LSTLQTAPPPNGWLSPAALDAVGAAPDISEVGTSVGIPTV
jgi:hypothetical protein